MAHFSHLNAVMYRIFGTSPPTRACVAVDLPHPLRVRLDIIAHRASKSGPPREALHVQSISYWAPANIGPYSQSIAVSGTRTQNSFLPDLLLCIEHIDWEPGIHFWADRTHTGDNGTSIASLDYGGDGAIYSTCTQSIRCDEAPSLVHSSDAKSNCTECIVLDAKSCRCSSYLCRLEQSGRGMCVLEPKYPSCSCFSFSRMKTADERSSSARKNSHGMPSLNCRSSCIQARHPGRIRTANLRTMCGVRCASSMAEEMAAVNENILEASPTKHASGFHWEDDRGNILDCSVSPSPDNHACALITFRGHSMHSPFPTLFKSLLCL